MLALDQRSVESESVLGFGTVTFHNRLITHDLIESPGPEEPLVSLTEDGKFL